jgi:uncharacterized membrane protein YdjX (TVP38/TMEM64 family)
MKTTTSFSVSNLESKKKYLKIIGAFFWVAIIAIFLWYKTSNDYTFFEIARQIGTLEMSAWGPLAFIVIYAVRPLIFFPATLLTILAGVLFGPIYGILYTVVGENMSANFAYWVGRFFGGDVKLPEGIARQLRAAAQKNSFETVLIARFVYMPFDLTNFGSGVLKVGWPSYFFATLIGIMPGLTTFVLLGASFDNLTEFDPSMIEFSPITFGTSAALFVGSLLLARYLKKRRVTH